MAALLGYYLAGCDLVVVGVMAIIILVTTMLRPDSGARFSFKVYHTAIDVQQRYLGQAKQVGVQGLKGLVFHGGKGIKKVAPTHNAFRLTRHLLQWPLL